MKINLVQYSPVWEQKLQNMEKLSALAAESGIPEGMMIFPEMTLTGFTMTPAAHAETLDGASFDFFSTLAKKTGNYCVFGFVESLQDKYYNTLCVVSPDGRLTGTYRKIHLFGFAGEDRSYTRGTEMLALQIEDIRFAFSICYDLRFPELFRRYTARGIDCIVNIANWPVPRIAHWNALLRARAIENLCYLAAVNRTGSDPLVPYNGCSSIITPLGETALSGSEEDVILQGEILSDVVKSTRNKFPFLDDMHLI